MSLSVSQCSLQVSNGTHTSEHKTCFTTISRRNSGSAVLLSRYRAASAEPAGLCIADHLQGCRSHCRTEQSLQIPVLHISENPSSRLNDLDFSDMQGSKEVLMAPPWGGSQALSGSTSTEDQDHRTICQNCWARASLPRALLDVVYAATITAQIVAAKRCFMRLEKATLIIILTHACSNCCLPKEV